MTDGTLRRPTRLILDYDGTLTVKDTMAVLGNLGGNSAGSWQEIVDAYLKDFDTYKKQPYPWKKYDGKEYSGWLAGRKSLEQRSAQRVQDAGFFRGATLDDVTTSVKAALESGELKLREGWLELFALFLSSYDTESGTTDGSSIEILSVNWSETAVRRGLYEAAKESGHAQKDELCKYINDMKIFANEIEGLGSPEGSSGRIVRPFDVDIRTSGDKLRYLKASLDAKNAFVVYVGDSSTDFDSLRAANLGIWLCPVAEEDSKKASKEVFKPLNYTPPSLESAKDLMGLVAMFYWAPDFKAVRAALTGE